MLVAGEGPQGERTCQDALVGNRGGRRGGAGDSAGARLLVDASLACIAQSTRMDCLGLRKGFGPGRGGAMGLFEGTHVDAFGITGQ